MLLYGASGHGKVIRDIIESRGMSVSHCFDDNNLLTEFDGIKVGLYSNEIFSAEELIISIGNNAIRKKISQKVNHSFGRINHVSSVISPRSFFSEGTVLMQGVVIQSSVMIGKHSIVNTSATIDHDCFIEDFVHISPNATLCGNVFIGEGSHIGAGAVIIQGIKIGKWATIGAGSIVTKDVSDYAVVVGNPARVLKYNDLTNE